MEVAMIEVLGFGTKAGLEYGFKGRLAFVHFDVCLFETLFMPVYLCMATLKMRSN